MSPFGFLRDGLFLLGCLAYSFNRWWLKPRVSSSFFHSYFNDLWLVPCALPFVLYVYWRLKLRHEGPPTLAEVAGHLTLWSVLFEWWGPRFFPGATGDVRDVFCYWIGGAVAWLWWNRTAMRQGLPLVG